MAWRTLFEPSTGVLQDVMADLPESALAVHTPPGMAWIDGRHDHRNRRVVWRPDDFGNAVVPSVEAMRPPTPPETEWQSWRWDEAAELYVAEPTAAALARDARILRDRLLSACDWTQGRDIAAEVSERWAPYRQALRDWPESPGFPELSTLPTRPITP